MTTPTPCSITRHESTLPTRLPSARAWPLVVCLLLVGLVLVGVTAPSARADETAAPGETPAPSPLEKARARWDARPDSINRSIKLQDALFAAGEAKQAESLFRARHRERKADEAAAFLYGRSRQDAEGLALMRQAMESGLPQASSKGVLGAWIALAVAEVEAGDGKRAAQAAARVAELRGLAADWIYVAWIEEALVGDSQAAIAAYRKAIAKDADHLGARNALVILLAGNRRAAEALKLALETVKAHPTETAAHLHLGLVHGLAGRSAQAAAALAKALESAGRDPDKLVEVAAAYSDIEEQELARKALATALQINPEHGRALAAAGILAMDQNRLKEAEDLLSSAAKVRPKDGRVAFLEGVCAERMGRTSAAAAAYGRAMKHAPERVDYVTALAMARMRSGSYRSAAGALKRAIKMDPSDASLHLQMGIAQMNLKKYKLARDAFEKAAELAVKDPRPHYYLAVIHGDKFGKSKLALSALERYEALGGNEPSAISWLKELRTEFPGG